MTLYISSTPQHFPYSTQLPTQLNYGGTSGIHHHQTRSKIPAWLSMDTSTPSTEEAERGSLTGDVATNTLCKGRAVTSEDELISVIHFYLLDN